MVLTFSKSQCRNASQFETRFINGDDYEAQNNYGWPARPSKTAFEGPPDQHPGHTVLLYYTGGSPAGFTGGRRFPNYPKCFRAGRGGALACVERMRLTTHAPILVLAPDKLSGPLLKAGADMCVPENLAPDMVTAHVLALLRRYTLYDHYDKRQPDRKAIQRGDIFIDPSRYTVLVRDRPVHLRLREFSLLHYFMRNPQLVLTPEQICAGAWKMEGGYGGDMSGPISILRRAIEPNPKAPIYIQTVNQVGYRFTAHFSGTGGE